MLAAMYSSCLSISRLDEANASTIEVAIHRLQTAACPLLFALIEENRAQIEWALESGDILERLIQSLEMSLFAAKNK